MKNNSTRPTLSALRNSVLALGILGCLFFSSAFVASFVNPALVEQVAKDVIRYQVELKVREKVEAIDSHFLIKKAEFFAQRYADDIALAKQQLSEQLPERIASVIAQMRNLDCECRTKIETSVREGYAWQILSASQAKKRLLSLIRTNYMETAKQLTREFRIFTASNALAFAFLIVALVLKRKAGIQLLPSAGVLMVAASATAYLYLFNQNWLHTIMFNDYVGFAYLGYLGVVFAFLCDIVFNRGLVTAEVLNWVLHALGSVVSVTPC